LQNFGPQLQTGDSAPQVVEQPAPEISEAAPPAVKPTPTVMWMKPEKTYTASSDLPMATLDAANMEQYMDDMMHWNRPGHVDGHWPDYEAFEHSDFDPNRWEGFEMYVAFHHHHVCA
jgi:hypothetical protein